MPLRANRKTITSKWKINTYNILIYSNLQTFKTPCHLLCNRAPITS